MVHRPIRRRVLVPLTLTLAVLLGAFLYTGYKIRHKSIANEMEHRYQGVQSLFQELMANRVDGMTTALDFLARDQELQKAMVEGDRRALLDTARPIYENLSRNHGITHFYFHTLDVRTFLRVHRPEFFKDSVQRYTMRRTLQSGKAAAGVELGPFGTFTLRVVYPWYSDGELIGYIELGQEIDQILQMLKTITHVDFFVSIDKEHLVRERWEKGMQMLGRTANWDLFPNKAVIDQTIETLPADLARNFSWESPQFTKHWEKIELADRTYAAKVFPLVDVEESAIGDFALLYDISKEMRTFSKSLLRTTLLSLVLCGALFVFAFRILGRMDLQLAGTQDKLQKEVKNATGMNLRLEGEVQQRQRIEDDLKRLNEHLESRVRERTVELENLNREIEANRQELMEAYRDLQAKQATILHQDKMACIGQLAAGVAHDINNPIGFVTSNLGELREYLPKLRRYLELQEQAVATGALPEACAALKQEREKMHLDDILQDLDLIIDESLEGAERVSTIVKSLRTFSRVDDTEMQWADLNDCLESTITMTANEYRYKATLHKELGELPALYCYPQQLNQVFMNLLINAAQAIESRGEIMVKTWEQNKSLYVSISDTGPGISQEVLPKIFEPFFTTKEVGKGTGLGLSITYDIVHKHGGEVSVQSRLGEGTAFTIRLPLEEEMADA